MHRQKFVWWLHALLMSTRAVFVPSHAFLIEGLPNFCRLRTWAKNHFRKRRIKTSPYDTFKPYDANVKLCGSSPYMGLNMGLLISPRDSKVNSHYALKPRISRWCSECCSMNVDLIQYFCTTHSPKSFASNVWDNFQALNWSLSWVVIEYKPHKGWKKWFQVKLSRPNLFA